MSVRGQRSSIPGLTSTSNRERRNRHPPENSRKKFIQRPNLLQKRRLHLGTRTESTETPPIRYHIWGFWSSPKVAHCQQRGFSLFSNLYFLVSFWRRVPRDSCPDLLVGAQHRCALLKRSAAFQPAFFGVRRLDAAFSALCRGQVECQVKVNIAFHLATFAVSVTLRNSLYSRVGDGPRGVIVGRSPHLLRAKRS
jgi:hypothetical protein